MRNNTVLMAYDIGLSDTGNLTCPYLARRYVRKYGNPARQGRLPVTDPASPNRKFPTVEIAEISRSPKAMGKASSGVPCWLSQPNQQLKERGINNHQHDDR